MLFKIVVKLKGKSRFEYLDSFDRVNLLNIALKIDDTFEIVDKNLMAFKNTMISELD